jgi:hypothetical protein
MPASLPIQISSFAILAATALVIGCDSSPTDLSDERTFLLVIQPSSATLQTGHRLQLNVTARGAEDRVRSTTDVLWSSGSDAIATVSADGIVTARGNGSAQIIAWWEGHRGVATVKVIERSAPKPCGELALATEEPNSDKISSCQTPPPGGGKR